MYIDETIYDRIIYIYSNTYGIIVQYGNSILINLVAHYLFKSTACTVNHFSIGSMLWALVTIVAINFDLGFLPSIELLMYGPLVSLLPFPTSCRSALSS